MPDLINQRSHAPWVSGVVVDEIQAFIQNLKPAGETDGQRVIRQSESPMGTPHDDAGHKVRLAPPEGAYGCQIPVGHVNVGDFASPCGNSPPDS